MTDLETMLRDGLSERAEDAGTWRAGGPALRETARRRRARRLRAGAATVTVLAALSAGAAVLDDEEPAPDRSPVGRPTPTASLAEPLPEVSWLSVQLTDDMFRRAARAAGVSPSNYRPIVATEVAGSGEVVVLLAGGRLLPGSHPQIGGLTVATVTFDSEAPGARVRSGTLGRYGSMSSLIALPARVGDGTVLVVLLPRALGDTVEVTSSRPGEPPARTSGFVDNRLALVPATGPEDVTGLRVLRAGRTVVATIPGGTLLGDDVPRTLDQVVASAGEGQAAQTVQVRTDGSTACRLTVGGWWWSQDPPRVPWNPSDAACAPADGDLHLLLAEDRHDSSVAGVAPADASMVRLHWRDGTVSSVRTSSGDVNAFLGPVTRRADGLIFAEAIDPDGAVLATARP